MSFPRPLRRGLLVVAMLMGSALALSACEYSDMTTLDPAGSHAQNIYNLLIPVAWAALGVFIVVEAMLVYSVVRFRRRDKATMPVQVHGNTRVEVMWTIAPALIVLVISVLTFRTQAENSVMPADALKITATGHQWWFQFDYPQQGVDTANEMYVPVGRPVTVQLEAADVMHNFWIPRLAGKTYMIPTKTNYLTFTANEPGYFYAQCAEFCGESHALMRFRVIALAPAAFDSWIAGNRVAPVAPAGIETGEASAATAQPVPTGTTAARPAAAPLPADPIARGRVLFVRKNCVTCHIINGVPEAVGRIGPNLTYFGNRTTLAAGVLPNTDENLKAWLHNPGEIKPGNLMSAQIKPGTLSDDEINALTAYLHSMKFPIDVPVASK